MITQERSLPFELPAESESESAGTTLDPVAQAVREGLGSSPKWLPAWLFYDAEGSELFERITRLPEYYLTRTERAIFTRHADNIVDAAMRISGRAPEGDGAGLRFVELGAGSASKTGILLQAAVQRQGQTAYLPVDVSASAMQEACTGIQTAVPWVSVYPQVANYVTDRLDIPLHKGPTLALYIGSSVGNFAPAEASSVLQNLRAQLVTGDSLLLGVDLVKPLAPLLAAYNDSSGVTAAFNLNVLQRINSAVEADFDTSKFTHKAIWNQLHSRIEMHLESTQTQSVYLRNIDLPVRFERGETIHTENSYKFTPESLGTLLESAGFAAYRTWKDSDNWFAVTVAAAV